VIPLRDNVPTRKFPVVTVGLIVACTVVWFWELTAPGLNTHVLEDGFYPCAVQGPCTQPETTVGHPGWVVTVFTSMFMHGGWVHIIGNMLFLWIFGNNVEDSMGRVRFLIWYLLAGIAATAVQAFVSLHFGNAQDASIPNIGASGAIAGVLGAYFVLLPRARVLTVFTLGFFFILREIRAIWFLGAWIVLQAISGTLSVTAPESGGGVAFFAHIGGFVFGVATIHLVKARRPVAPTPRFP
jgi:membrane associated rhomboid family serine protease